MSLALALSTFLAGGPGATWVKLDPLHPARPAVIASFPNPPAGARAAWSANRKRGLVWFDPSNRGYVNEREEPVPPGLKERLYLVDLGLHATRALALPPVGTLRDVGYDASGAALALTEQEVKLEEDKKGRSYVDFEGKRYTPNPAYEGAPVLVHAFQLQPDHTWKRLETKMSGTGSDYAPGVDVLAAAKALGARSSQWLDSRREREEIKDAGAKARLARFTPRAQENDGWNRFPGTILCIWTITGEFAHNTGRLAFDDGRQAVLAPGLPWGPRDPVALNRRGGYMLATCAGSGSHARLWELGGRKLVYHQDKGWDTVFWPD